LEVLRASDHLRDQGFRRTPGYQTISEAKGLEGLYVGITIIILTSGHVQWFGALAGAFNWADLEDCANGTAVLSGLPIEAYEVLAAVLRVGVPREGPEGSYLPCCWA